MVSPILKCIKKRIEDERKWYDSLLELLAMILIVAMGILFWAVFGGGPK